MAKVKISKIAQEYSCDPDFIMGIAKEEGIAVKNASATVTHEDYLWIQEKVESKKKAGALPPPPPPKKKAVKKKAAPKKAAKKAAPKKKAAKKKEAEVKSKSDDEENNIPEPEIAEKDVKKKEPISKKEEAVAPIAEEKVLASAPEEAPVLEEAESSAELRTKKGKVKDKNKLSPPKSKPKAKKKKEKKKKIEDKDAGFSFGAKNLSRGPDTSQMQIQKVEGPRLKHKPVRVKKALTGPAKRKSDTGIFNEMEQEMLPTYAALPMSSVAGGNLESYIAGMSKSKGGRPVRRRRPRSRRRGRSSDFKNPVVIPESIEVIAPVTLRDISAKIGLKANTLMMFLMKSGTMLTINEVLDEEAILQISVEYNCEINQVVTKVGEEKLEDILSAHTENVTDEDKERRAPVVAFLGHVDHGKTTLMDKIRGTSIVDGEHGGITQHIRAHQVHTSSGIMTFLDTPGHSAFSEMRSRGANITDIVIIIIAADDGVMPQTEEAISHAKASGAEIIVAINKMDMPGANPDKVKQQLSGLGLQPTDWGGETDCVEVSAITGDGVEDLLETIHYHVELLDLKAHPSLNASGFVVEARIETGRGAVATLLVRDGTLKVGQYILVDQAIGTVRSLTDEFGKVIATAGPAMPVELTGIDEVPSMGAKFVVHDNLQELRKISEEIKLKKAQEFSGSKVTNLAELLTGIKADTINVIIKADVKGSLEVIEKSLLEMNTTEIRISVMHRSVGAINESDVSLAHASKAIILGFHVNVDDTARLVADRENVDLRLYFVLYTLIDELRDVMEGRLIPEVREINDGAVIVKDVFKVSRLGTIAGCQVSRGFVNRNSKIRLFRDGILIHTGIIETLRRFKDDVKQVEDGFECGVKIDYDDLKIDDTIEAFHFEEFARKLADVEKVQAPKKEEEEEE